MLFKSSPLSPLTIFFTNEYAQTCRMILIIVLHSIIRRLYLARSVDAYFPIAYIMNYRENRPDLPILRIRIKQTIHDTLHVASKRTNILRGRTFQEDKRFQEDEQCFRVVFFYPGHWPLRNKENKKRERSDRKKATLDKIMDLAEDNLAKKPENIGLWSRDCPIQRTKHDLHGDFSPWRSGKAQLLNSRPVKNFQSISISTIPRPPERYIPPCYISMTNIPEENLLSFSLSLFLLRYYRKKKKKLSLKREDW